MTVSLVTLTPGDIAEVMRIERSPGYEGLISQFTADEHAAEFASPDARYLGFREPDGLGGFVILQEFRLPTVLLRRIALAQPGQGRGTALFRQAVDWIFANSSAQAVRLHVARINDRARHIYLREGFTIYETGDNGDLMSITREQWGVRA